MVNIKIQNLEVESTALNQVSPGEMEKVLGGVATFFDIDGFNTSVALFFGISGYLALLELIDGLA